MLHIIATSDSGVLASARLSLRNDDDVIILGDILGDANQIKLFSTKLNNTHILFTHEPEKFETSPQASNINQLKIIDAHDFVALSIKHLSIITWQ